MHRIVKVTQIQTHTQVAMNAHAGRQSPRGWQLHGAAQSQVQRRRRCARAGAGAEAVTRGDGDDVVRIRVGVLCGGPTLERGISLNSGRSVFDHLHGQTQTIGIPGSSEQRRSGSGERGRSAWEMQI